MSDKVPKGWKKVKLGEICNNISYGYTASAKLSPVGPKFLRITDIVADRINWDTVPYCQISKENIKKYKLEVGDIVIARTGATTGYNKIIKDNIKSVFASYLIRYKVNKGVADPFFVAYNLQSYKWKGFVDNIIGGSAQPGANAKQFASYEFFLPPLPEQKAIASVLSSLDDKIDLLHRQNKTLEKMAETLFRQWFVEEAKEDWEEKKLEEVCVIRNGYAFKSETYQEIGQKIIRTLNFKNGFVNTEKIVYISDELAKFFSKYFLNRKDFLLVMVGANIGNYAVVTKDILPALQNQNMWCFKALQPDFQFYLNYYLKQMIKEKKNIVSGSAREFFQKKVFANFIIPIPENIKLRQFNEIVEDIFSKIENNRTQIRTLEKLRDTLLPKLMSGQIRVKI